MLVTNLKWKTLTKNIYQAGGLAWKRSIIIEAGLLSDNTVNGRSGRQA